jgi:spore maturation protein SpmA
MRRARRPGGWLTLGSLSISLRANNPMRARAPLRTGGARFGQGGPLLNAIWVGLVVVAVLVAAFTGRMEAVSQGAIEATKESITFLLGLVGGMILFLGLVKVASEGGLLRAFVRLLHPVLRRLFPDVPADHPAMQAIVMNFAANMLGLGNAATPFGLKAMVELDRLNPHRGSATNAMALFLSINATSITLMPPTGTVFARAAAGSEAPFVIWIPTLIATTASTLTAVLVCLALQNRRWFRPRPPASVAPAAEADLPEAKLPGLDGAAAPAGPWRTAFVLAVLGLLLCGLGLQWAEHAPASGTWPFLRDQVLRHWLLPILMLGFVSIGVLGRVRVYDVLIEGGKEGLGVVARITPYVVVILVAARMFRDSGALDLVIGAVDPLTSALGFPAEALPMAILRPLSGSGAFAVMMEALTAYGPDSFVGLLVSTLQGSTETTFYVLAVYLGVIGVRDSRHIVFACLAGDLAGYAAATAACHAFFG